MKYIIIPIILVVCVIALVLYLYLHNTQGPQQVCNIDLDESKYGYSLCCTKYQDNAEVITEDCTTKDTFKCGDGFRLEFKFRNVSLPENFIICERDLVAGQVGNKDPSSINTKLLYENNRSFAWSCTDMIIKSYLTIHPNLRVINRGRVPSTITGNVSLLDVFIYPSILNSTSMKDILNNQYLATKIFSKYVTITC